MYSNRMHPTDAAKAAAAVAALAATVALSVIVVGKVIGVGQVPDIVIGSSIGGVTAGVAVPSVLRHFFGRTGT